MNTFDLTLDLDKSITPAQVVRIRQADHDGTTINATIYDHGAALASTPDACSFAMRLPDGAHYYRKSATYSGGVATVTIDETQAASVVGRTVLAYFSVTFGTSIYSTGAFAVIIEPDAVGDAELPEDYDSEIQAAIDRCNEAAAAIEDALPIDTADLKDGAVTSAKLASSSVTSGKIASGSVSTAKLADGSVTSPKLSDAVRNGYVRTYDTVAQMQADSGLDAGMTCHTNGFHTSGDSGAAYYTVGTSGTANNCTVLACANNLVATRVFTENYVTLESLNFANVAYSLINTVVSSAGIGDVRCGAITTSSPISVDDYDFTFESITYTGTDAAIIIDGVQNHVIKGNEIVAASGTCIEVTCSTRNCLSNTIAVQYMSAGVNGIDILPVNGHGITYNRYEFGRIIATGTGINSYIPANTGKYSWQGEEVFSVQNAQANKGVSIVIDPVNNVSVDGTITGITFLNLAVEGSDTGVYISAGINANASTVTAGIKSITINNMRCREYERTTTFLQLNGYVRSLYVKPTSEIRLHQWSLATRVEKTQEAVIDAPIFNYGMNHAIGEVLACHNNTTYIKKRRNSVMYVDGNIDFSTMASSSSELYMPRLFRVRNTSVGDVTIKLDYFYEDSAQDVLFSILEGHKVTVTFPNGAAKAISNTGSERSLFSVSCMRTDNAELTNYYVIRNLGAYSS